MGKTSSDSVFVTVHDDVVLVEHSETGEPLWVHIQVGTGPQGPIHQLKEPKEQVSINFATMVRWIFSDPRMEEMFPEGFERVATRNALRRAKPGEVVEVDAELAEAMRKIIRKPQGLNPHALYSGALDLVRCILDAPSTDPRETGKVAPRSSAQA